jgi:hypothetical protein
MHTKDIDDFMRSVLSDIAGDAVEWVGENLDPGDVFSPQALSDWAIDHGFVKEDD